MPMFTVIICYCTGDRPPYNTTLPYSTASNSDPYHRTTMTKSYTSSGQYIVCMLL